MKAVFEHVIVILIAIVMATIGYWLIDRVGSVGFRFLDQRWGWICWIHGVSALTWLCLYRICREIHWMVLPIIGLFAPIVGSILFFPFTPWAWVMIGQFAVVVFPWSVVTGFLITLLTLPFRPPWVLP